MRKRMIVTATGILALIVTLVMATSGCAPKTDAGAASNGATTFFPNVSI